MKGIKYLNENFINDRRIANKTGVVHYQLSEILDDFSEHQNKELIEEKKTMLIDFCKSRMNERQWSVSSGYEIRAVNYYLNQFKANKT